MKSAKRDFKKLPVELKNRVKKIIKRIRKGKINPEKLTDMGNSWKIKVGSYRMIMEKKKETFIFRALNKEKTFIKSGCSVI